MASTPRMLPGVAAPSLVGRMGSEPLRERGDVRYLPLRARSLVNRCSSPRMPFEFTVNPYRGCAMGCRYCYAVADHEAVQRRLRATRQPAPAQPAVV